SSPTVSMYFLEWMKAEDANNPWVTLLPKATKGFAKRKVMVYGSSISMLLIRRNSGASPLADPSLAIAAMVNLISSAVISPWPSWNCTPLRREKRQARPPSNTSQRSASMGERAPVLGSRLSKFSIMGLSTTSSAPGYRCGNQRSLPKVATATVSVPSGDCADASPTPRVLASPTTSTILQYCRHPMCPPLFTDDDSRSSALQEKRQTAGKGRVPVGAALYQGRRIAVNSEHRRSCPYAALAAGQPSGYSVGERQCSTDA